MTSMLREVVLHGTAIAAASLKYPLAGKTGTTNNFTDAWFVGFSPSLTCGVWIGYDEKKFLGAKESGARAALPIWMDFMKVALEGKDSGEFQPPEPTPNSTPRAVDTPDTAPPAEETHKASQSAGGASGSRPAANAQVPAHARRGPGGFSQS